MHIRLIKRLKDWAFTKNTVESRPLAYVRSAFRISLILIHVFFKTHIPLRASALTYSIILSLVPMLAMSTAILKGMGSDNELKIAAYRLIDQIDPSTPKVQPQETTREATLRENKEDKEDLPVSNQNQEDYSPATMTGHLRNGVNMIFDYADKTNFAALGAFGIVGLVFVVLLMLNNIEITMNAIWHSKKSRPLGRKIMDYLALLLLLPISLNAAFAGDTILQSPKMMGYITTAVPSEWLVKMLFKGLPFLFIVGSLTFMYQFFPYAKVKTYAAFAGAIFSAICWFGVQQIYIALQIGVSKYNAIYGSFATVPLFLIWLHLGWMFLLLGAALAYAVQNRDNYHPFRGSVYTPQRRLQLAFDILQATYNNFANHLPITDEELSQLLANEPMTEVKAMSETLIEGGLLHRVAGGNELTMSPALPIEELKAEHILDLVLGNDKLDSAGGHFAETVLAAAAAGAPFPVFTPHSNGGTHAIGK